MTKTPNTLPEEQEKISEFLRKKAHHLLDIRFDPKMHEWMDVILDELLTLQQQRHEAELEKEREKLLSFADSVKGWIIGICISEEDWNKWMEALTDTKESGGGV